MGRPRKDDGKNYRKQLSWFKLSRYTGTRNLTVGGWLQQIAFRKDVLFCAELYRQEKLLLTGPVFYPDPRPSNELFEMLQCNPLVDIESLERQRPDLFEQCHNLVAYKHLTGHDFCVRFATVRDFYLTEKNANPWLIDDARAFFDSLGNMKEYIVNKRPGYFEDVRQRYFREWEIAHGVSTTAESVGPRYHFWMEDPFHVYAHTNSRIFLAIDPSAPDSILEQQFKAIVKSARRDSETIRSPKFFPGDWADIGLLPYIDLKIWTILNDRPEIPDYILRDTILLPSFAQNHTIAERTKKAYSSLMEGNADGYNLLRMKAQEDGYIDKLSMEHKTQ